MTRLTIILFTLLTATACSQTKTIPGLNLYKAKVKSIETDTTLIAGLTLKADKYIVNSRTKVTTRTSFTGTNNKYKTAKIQVAVYHVHDTTCKYLDAIYDHIAYYWKGQEEWANKYHNQNQTDTTVGYVVTGNDTIFFGYSSYGDFSALPVNEGFLKSGDKLIPFIQPMHGRIGTYRIYWFDQHIHKVVLLKSTGLGGIGFVGQNMLLTKDGKEYPFEDFATRQLGAMKELLKNENKVNCAQQ
ncbi:MAG: hypothetical protein COW67_06905 [Flavobacteriales bacterium CG18_big_fil_WC_8_21_14_2_50_32_9]|nr:MAG: hypothetical protein COW67_06905 [Flavobacteriales bacterium CG18_big_fil_WC_8_21_14_2_50_32_9]